MARQQRATRTRHALIRSAAQVFAEQGFVAASLGAISRQAGVSNGALHFHFANKEALAEAVETEAAATVLAITRTAHARHGDSLQAVVDATHELMGALARDIVVRGGFEAAGDVTRRRRSLLWGQWHRWVEDCLCRAERNGALARGVAWGDAAHVVIAATAGFEALGSEDGAWRARRSVTRFWELMLPRLADPDHLGTLVCAGSAEQYAEPQEPVG
ncbi:ScbR family autoregulator-binding transcription factor [Streptomyces sp. NPDC085529]|uniref:ScbR family autoregulator-binding transcription factor n=1 Tax=Streptomyces sp. NPDC085529 TaxID=3365729 RepID=UPI0037D7AE54